MSNADWLLDLPAIRREFRALRSANNFGDARRASSVRFSRLDLDPAKRGGLLQFTFINMIRAGEVADGQSSGVLI